jgi:hypothetical protein
MKTIFLCLFISINLSAQNISNTRLEAIVESIVSNSPDISKYFFPEELDISNRFGISYQETENKYFIANEFPKINEKTDCDFKINNLEDNYSLLTITVPSQNRSQEYYLKDSSIVSKPFYYSRNWKVKESNHFKFFISDENHFNNYSIDQLEKFIAKMVEVLKFSEQQKNEIEQKKIYYFLCKDETEILKVTGFATRGIYLLAQDYVITTYNTHYHELVHFLINFKLKDLPLYTHPFLQEGFAVAFGGRGGLDVHTIFETGIFLVKAGFANYSELLSRNGFHNMDASVSYPISGLYVDFLLKQIGIEKIIELYKKYSASEVLNLIEIIDKSDLPPDEKWNLYVDSLVNENPIQIVDQVELNKLGLIKKKEDYEVYQNKEEYLFRVKDRLLISLEEKLSNYQSKIFNEHFTNREYKSEKYLIIANQNEISIYNLYSNNLIGKYVASFSIPTKTVLKKNNFYEFVVKKDLFDEDWKERDFSN